MTTQAPGESGERPIATNEPEQSPHIELSCNWCGSAMQKKAEWCPECGNFAGSTSNYCRYCRFPLPNVNNQTAKHCYKCGKGQTRLSSFTLSAQTVTSLVTLLAAIIALSFSFENVIVAYDKIFIDEPLIEVVDISDTNGQVEITANNHGDKQAIVTIDRLRLVKENSTSKECTSSLEDKNQFEYVGLLDIGSMFCRRIENKFVVGPNTTSKITIESGWSANNNLKGAVIPRIRNAIVKCYVEYSTNIGETLAPDILLKPEQCINILGLEE